MHANNWWKKQLPPNPAWWLNASAGIAYTSMNDRLLIDRWVTQAAASLKSLPQWWGFNHCVPGAREPSAQLAGRSIRVSTPHQTFTVYKTLAWVVSESCKYLRFLSLEYVVTSSSLITSLGSLSLQSRIRLSEDCELTWSLFFLNRLYQLLF